MTIRLTGHVDQATVRNNPPRVSSSGTVLAYADTEAEAEQAKRAFEQVLLPRFTRDEAIAIVKAHRGVDAVITVEPMTNARREYLAGVRAALEALAAAGVFVDGDVIVRDLSGNGNDLVAPTMADKLDAAGIR